MRAKGAGNESIVQRSRVDDSGVSASPGLTPWAHDRP